MESRFRLDSTASLYLPLNLTFYNRRVFDGTLWDSTFVLMEQERKYRVKNRFKR